MSLLCVQCAQSVGVVSLRGTCLDMTRLVSLHSVRESALARWPKPNSPKQLS